MAPFVASAPVEAASENPLLAPVVKELMASRFALFDQDQFWVHEGETDSDLPPASWGAHFQEEGSHLGIVVSITGRGGDWGISIKSTPCGRNGGVCYWESVGGPITKQEAHWPGLHEAVKNARQLAIQYRAR